MALSTAQPQPQLPHRTASCSVMDPGGAPSSPPLEVLQDVALSTAQVLSLTALPSMSHHPGWHRPHSGPKKSCRSPQSPEPPDPGKARPPPCGMPPLSTSKGHWERRNVSAWFGGKVLEFRRGEESKGPGTRARRGGGSWPPPKTGVATPMLLVCTQGWPGHLIYL